MLKVLLGPTPKAKTKAITVLEKNILMRKNEKEKGRKSTTEGRVGKRSFHFVNIAKRILT